MSKRAWLAAATVGLAASMLLAEPGIVTTTDGQRYEGDVKEDNGTVIVTMHNVQTRFNRGDVGSIEYPGNYEQDYKARLAKLDAKDVDGRIAMAREAFNRGHYELARSTLEGALAIDPNNRQASDLLESVESQIRLERVKLSPWTPPPAPASRPALTGQAAIEQQLLTTNDIQSIRRQELQAHDTTVRLRFDGDVKKRFADSQKIAYANFVDQPQVMQAMQIFTSGDDSMRSQVQVMNDPRSILEFRENVLPLVQRNCATSGCHGGPSGAGFIIYTGGNNDAIAYTDFYIMQSFSKRTDEGSGGGNIFGGNVKLMINRSHPEQSLLANYGLPQNVGMYTHPLVGGKPIQPIFPNTQDAKYQMVLNWMSSLNQISPDYGIHYTAPAASISATTQPAK